MKLTGFRSVLFAAVAAMGVTAFGGKLADGGVEKEVDEDVVHIFSQDGTFTVKKPITAWLLVVGGGGAGGVVIGGGGGGGEVIERNNVVLQPGTYTVTVGAGGRFDDDTIAAMKSGNWRMVSSGTASSFDLGDSVITAGGGGGGGSFSNNKGQTGACGGGSCCASAVEGGVGSVANGGASVTSLSGGGGGASGEAGGVGEGTTAGKGGAGFVSDITGEELDYGAGGGGGAGNQCEKPGEPGGPSAGRGAVKDSQVSGEAGLDGRGGGGGGGSYQPATAGGKGGDGCVIIRYAAVNVDTVFRVASNLPGIGAPTPNYGDVDDRVVGDKITCTVAETVVSGSDGSWRATLTGWELQTLDSKGHPTGVIRSSEKGALEGESFNTCLYTHAGFARLMWLWDIERPVEIADTVITSNGRAEFTVTTDVRGLGLPKLPEGRIYVAWGQTADRLTETNLVATVTDLGEASGTVNERLVPNVRHYAKVFVEAGGIVAEDPQGVMIVNLKQELVTPLPGGYLGVEYIESDKTQTIKTGVKAGDDTEIDIRFMTCKDVSVESAIFGSTTGWSGSAYLAALQSKQIRWYGATGAALTDLSPDTFYRVQTIADGKIVRVLDGDGNVIGKLTDQVFTGGEITLFSANGQKFSQVRLISCKIWKAGELVRDYLPAARLADGKIGLYDCAGKEFKPQDMGNNFVAGPKCDVSHVLEIRGNPEDFATVKPDYGYLPNLKPGDAFTCLGGEAIETGDSRASCTSWTLYTPSTENPSEWVEFDSGLGNRMEYVHPTASGAKLVWNWETQYRVALTAAEGGSVKFTAGDAQEGWFAFESVQRIEATPEDGWTFAYWTGDVPNAQSMDNPLDLTVVKSSNIQAHFIRGQVCAWKGGSSGGSASDPANWANGILPVTGETVFLAPPVAENPLVWDLKDVVPGAWLQVAGYTNTVTIATTFADGEGDYPVFRVSGDVRIEDGCWKHHKNPTPPARDVVLYLLRAEIGGDLTIGARAKIDASGLGYPTRTGRNFGEGRGPDAYGGNNFGPSSGGDGVNQNFGSVNCPMGYGSVFEPLDCGASSYYVAGGGVIRLVAGGTLTVDGVICADGEAYTKIYCSAAGGSVWITAGRLAGTGVIRANGGDVWGYYQGGAGGRIALYLTEQGATFDSFEGLVAAYASSDFNTKHPVSMNCGTIYEQTADEQFRCGTIIVRNDPASKVEHGTTTLPVEGTTAAELKQTKLVVGAATRLRFAQDLTIKDLTIESTSAKLDLQGHNLKVKTPWHAYPQETVLNAGEWIDGKRPNWSNITWGGSGLVILFQ